MDPTQERDRDAMTAELDGGLKRRLASGIGAQGVTFALMLVLQFLIVPVYLSRWTTDVYADWLVLQATTNLLLMADLGFQGHLTNGLRLSWARGDAGRFRRIVRAGLGAYAILMALGAALFVALADDVATALNLRALHSATPVLILLGLSVLAVLPRGLMSSVYNARGQLGREVTINFIQLAGQIAAQAVTVLAGGSPVQVAAAHLAATLLFGWGVLLADLRVQHADVGLRPSLPNRDEWLRLLRSAPLHAVPLGGAMLTMQIPVIALGQLAAGAGAVVAFTTMRTLTGMARQLAAQVSIAAGFEMVRQHAQHDQNGMIRLHAVTGRLIGAMTGLATGPILVLGPAFFALWSHGTIPFDAALAAAFLGTILLMVPAYGALTLLRNSENPAPLAAGTLIQIVASTLLCIALIPRFGATGAALAVGAAEVLALAPVTLRVASRRFAIPILPFLGRTLVTTLLSLLLGTVAALLAGHLLSAADPAGLGLVLLVWAAALPLPAAFLLLTPGERAWLWGLRLRAPGVLGRLP